MIRRLEKERRERSEENLAESKGKDTKRNM
jgi:hypothetical protein